MMLIYLHIQGYFTGTETIIIYIYIYVCVCVYGLKQNCSNPIANALEKLQFCIKPSIWL